MTKCYLSGEVITPENSSREHIIPDFLGGRITSKRLMTKKWNEELGRTIDAELSRQIKLMNFVPLKTRGKKKVIPMYRDDRQKYLYDSEKKTAEIHSPQPELVQDESGKERKKITGEKAIRDYMKHLQRKHPNLSKKEIEEKYEIEIVENDEDIVGYNQCFKHINGVEAYRAIAKIAANFYVYSTQDIIEVQPIAEFIKTGKGNNCIVYPYYNIQLSTLNLPGPEPFHVLYLKGDPTSQVLYCYIELFNVYNFVVGMSNKYTGNAIEFYYSQSLKNGKYNQEPFNISIDLNDILNMLQSKVQHFQEKYKKRIHYFCDSVSLKLSGTEISADFFDDVN